MPKVCRLPVLQGRLNIFRALIAVLASFVCISLAGASSNVVAWGAGKFVANPSDFNDYGQSIIPASLTNAAEIAGGWRFSLALRNNGILLGWGDDSLLQTTFSGGSNFVAIACGRQHSLALNAKGRVWGAGDDYYGQIDIPTNLANVVAVSCGFYHNLVLKSDGTVAAWGTSTNSSRFGQDYVSFGQALVPAGLSNVVAVAAGAYHNLVLKSDGTLLAWGDNDFGQTNIPVGLTNVVAIAAGGGHNLALTANGLVTAWGENIYNQATVPAGLSNVVAIACGGWHSLALKNDGTVVAWGAVATNASIACGQATVPTGLTNVVQIAGGTVHSLALIGMAPPSITSVLSTPIVESNQFSVKLNSTRNGRVYQLQFKSSLSENTWQSLPLMAGTGGSLTLTDPNRRVARFYRAVVW